MNELYEKLFAQAWIEFAPGHKAVLERFAELIVRECIEQGKQIQLQTVSNGSKDYVDGREMGIEVFMNQIKETFWS